MNFLLLSIFFPLLSGLILSAASLFNKNINLQRTAVLLALVQFVLVLISGAGIGEANPTAFVPWVSTFGINLSFELTGPAFLLTLFSSLIFINLLVFAGAQLGILQYLLLFTVQSSLYGALTSVNLLLFYFFYELMILPIFLMLILEQSKELKRAVYKCIIYTLSSSLVMLAAIIFLAVSAYKTGGQISFEIKDLLNLNLTADTQRYLLLAFIFAFAVKSPLVPFHSWQPAIYSLSPNFIAIFFSSLLFQVGIFGVYKFCFTLFPAVISDLAPILAVLGVASILLGSLVAWRELGLRRALAYASIAHIGFSFLGLGSLNYAAVSGAIYLIITHILIAAGLFILACIFENNSKSTQFGSVAGLAKTAPRFSFFMLCFSLASISLPLTASFVGEFMVLADTFFVFPLLGSLALIGVILGAVYMLNICRQMLFGEARGEFQDLTTVQQLVLAPIILLILLLGIYPQPILRFINTDSQLVLGRVEKEKSKTVPLKKYQLPEGTTNLQLANLVQTEKSD